MASTSLSLGKHWEEFLKSRVASGEFSTVSEVIRAALRDLEEKTVQHQRLKTFIAEGEMSGYVDWNPDTFKDRINAKPSQFGEKDQQAFNSED